MRFGRRKAALGMCLVLVVLSGLRQAQAQDPQVAMNHVPGSAIGVVTSWPQRISKKESLRLMPLEVVTAAGMENVGIDPWSIGRLDVFFGFPGPTGPQFGVLVQLTEATDIADLRSELFVEGGPQQDGDFVYYRIDVPEELVLHQVDERTAIFGTLDFVKQMATQADPSCKLAGILGNVRGGGGHDLMAIATLDALRPMLQRAPFPPPIADDSRSALDLTDFAAIRVQLAPKESIQVLLSAEDGGKAVELEKAVGNLLDFAQQTIEEDANRSLENDTETGAAMRAYVKRLMGEIRGMLKPKRNGNTLLVEAEDVSNMGVVATLTGLLLPAVQAAREAARRTHSSNNLKQVGLALHNFHDAYGSFPATAGLDADGEPMLSWRVAILPFIEQQQLYEQFKLDEPWDSEHNLALLPKMPPVYRHPGKMTQPGHTVYQATVSDESLLRLKEPTKFAQITDGTSNTIMVIETTDAAAVPWTAPSDYQIDADAPSKNLFQNGITNVLMGDGSVHVISEAVDLGILKALFTRAGGERDNF